MKVYTWKYVIKLMFAQLSLRDRTVFCGIIAWAIIRPYNIAEAAMAN